MLESKLYIYKIPERIKKTLTAGGINYIEIEDIQKFKHIKEGVVLTPALMLFAHEYLLCRVAMTSNLKNIAIYDKAYTTEKKEILYECGVKHFLSEDADLYDILSVLPCDKSVENPTLSEAVLLPDSLINKIATPIFIKDTNSRFISCNDAFCEYFGRKREEIIGNTSYVFSNNKKAQIYEEADKRVFESGEDRQHAGKIVRSDGTIYNAIIKKSPLYASDGSIYGLIGIVTDVTDLKQRERDLKEEKIKAKASDKLKTSFLSNMSHEIRTPMNAIVGFSQLLTTPNLQDDKKKVYVEQINHNAAQLLKLIEDIIEVSKIEAGKVEMSKDVCYINQLLDEIYISFEAHKGILGKTNLELVLKKEKPEADFNIITDQYRLNQVLTNLLGNALKFTETGTVEFGYTFAKFKGEDYLEFYVKDTGLGINQEKLPYVFDRFSKIPASKTKLYGGTGIGLSISKSLVELLGGRIYVESEEGKGTTFYFTIPLIQDVQKSENKTERETVKMPVEKHYNWSDKQILIAEDEEMNYLYLQEVLKNTKAKLTWKQNGAEAVEEVRMNPNYDAVLMDIKMPQMDGYEATRIIKNEYPKLPVIIQTAYAMKAERDKGFAVGCDEYIEKPVNKEILLEIIEDYFNG